MKSQKQQGNDRLPPFWSRFRRCFGAKTQQVGKEFKEEVQAGTSGVEDVEREIRTQKWAVDSGRHCEPAYSDKNRSRTLIKHTSKHDQPASKEKQPRKNRETKRSNVGGKSTSEKAKKRKEVNIKPAKAKPAGIDFQFFKLLADSQTAVRNLHIQLSVFTAETINSISRNTHTMPHLHFCDHSWITTICTSRK
jgi:hypothetical protein